MWLIVVRVGPSVKESLGHDESYRDVTSFARDLSTSHGCWLQTYVAPERTGRRQLRWPDKNEEADWSEAHPAHAISRVPHRPLRLLPDHLCTHWIDLAQRRNFRQLCQGVLAIARGQDF